MTGRTARAAEVREHVASMVAARTVGKGSGSPDPLPGAPRFRLLSTNPKLTKSCKLRVITFALHLAPADTSGRNVCRFASPGCRAACLNTAGRGGIFPAGASTNLIQDARKRRTVAFFGDRRSVRWAHVRRSRTASPVPTAS